MNVANVNNDHVEEKKESSLDRESLTDPKVSLYDWAIIQNGAH